MGEAGPSVFLRLARTETFWATFQQRRSRGVADRLLIK